MVCTLDASSAGVLSAIPSGLTTVAVLTTPTVSVVAEAWINTVQVPLLGSVVVVVVMTLPAIEDAHPATPAEPVDETMEIPEKFPGTVSLKPAPLTTDGPALVRTI